MGAVSIETIPGDDDELPELADLPDDAVLLGEPAAQAAPSRERERSRGHARSARRGRADEREDQDEDEDERIEPVRAEPHKKRVILVNARDSEEKRVAVVEEGRIVDLQMTVKKHVSYVNDIYRGRVVNIESAIGAAFVDFGEGRNGFLHASDVLVSYGDPDWNLEKLLSTPVETTPPERATEEWAEGEKPAEGEAAEAGDEPDPLHDDDAEQAPDHEHGDHDDEHEAHAGHESADDEEDDDVEEPSEGRGRSARGKRGRVMRHHARPRLPIDKLLKKGQMVAVQITKDAIGDKGPTLTTYISIPGRYLVLMPSLERTGVSRKIDDERERRRLKRILQALDIPEGMGVIVRTAGIGRTKIEIKRDLDYLLLAWEDFSKRLRAGRNPAPLYQESDVAIRTMRDLFTPETEAVIVDDPEVHQRVIEFTKRLMPEHLERVKLHEGERPLLHSYGVEQDFEKIFARRVELPSGGSIVIEQTEALVAIDVNSGRTREEGAEFEDIALKTNLEAAPEIARQIRLRDLGGIIVLDYIDMMRAGSRKSVERATRDAMGADRARAKLGRISQFGLLELTRQRLGPGLSKLVYDTCPRCRGSGRRRNASSRAQAIMRRLAAALALKGYTTVEVRTHPDAIEYLQKELAGDMKALQEKSGREIQLLPVPDQVEDSVLHYLRADGREVRPGGRRRR
ncbi:MAG: Rne/Rng family ribonuclease [Planctomycetes bacterium]|nr:Rne/Rng family ribonuclease [Planctomycetota bacterium]